MTEEKELVRRKLWGRRKRRSKSVNAALMSKLWKSGAANALEKRRGLDE